MPSEHRLLFLFVHTKDVLCSVPQLDLHKAAPKGALGVAQHQVQAEANVAVAFQRRKPLMLLKAADAFRRLEQAAAQVGQAAASGSSCCF